MWPADLWDFMHPFYGRRLKSLPGNLHLLWEIKRMLQTEKELSSHCPAASGLDGPWGRWVCILRHCKDLGACLSGCASVAQCISALQVPNPCVNGPVFLGGRSRPWQGYKLGSQKQYCLASIALSLKPVCLASQPTSYLAHSMRLVLLLRLPDPKLFHAEAE